MVHRHVSGICVAAALVCCASTSTVERPAGANGDGGGPTSEADAGGGGTEGEGGYGPPACPTAGALTTTAIDSPDSNETSGIVASKKNAGAYWIHNDSGDTARAFAVDASGKLLATLSFDAAKPDDIEDVAIEDDGDTSFLYFGDIGDNAEARSEIVIHRVEEPKLGGTSALDATSQKMTVVYADGAHNAETLLFDPIAKELLIATKSLGGPSTIHRVGAFQAGKKVTTEKIATVDVTTATGGDISRDGRYVAIRSYSKTAFVWFRGEGETLAQAFARAPCELPLATETQGEAFGWQTDGKGYVTVSEGTPELHVTKLQ